jgi:hypothetical protein
MWKTLMIIALVTALVQWLLFSISGSGFVLIHAFLWTAWTGFCYYRHKTDDYS